jgi:hypothetical protein
MSEAGLDSPGCADFAEFRKNLEATKGIQFFSRVEDVPPVVDGVKRLAIISAREYHVASGFLNSSLMPLNGVRCLG